VTPTLVASYPAYSAASNTTALTTPSFTPASGEIIVVKRATEDSAHAYSGVPSGGSLTYTSRASDNSGSHCYVDIYTAVGAGASMTVSSGALSTSAWHSMMVERWSGAQLAATPATNSTKTGTGAPSATVITVASNSIVTSVNADWAAIAPTGRAYRSSANEDGLHDKSTGNYVAYFFYQTAAASGSQTIGLTAPTGETWSMLGIEIQDAGGVTPLPELVMPQMR